MSNDKKKVPVTTRLTVKGESIARINQSAISISNVQVSNDGRISASLRVVSGNKDR